MSERDDTVLAQLRNGVPETLRIASAWCTKVDLSHTPGLGVIQIHYARDSERCGRCLLCVLLYQFPANETPRVPR